MNGELFSLSMDTIRFYDRFISLGLNCETSFLLYKVYGGAESSLFQWATVPAAKLLEVLGNLSLIYSGKIIEDEKTNMWKCAVTHINFHGVHTPAELFDEHGKRDKEKVRAELKNTKERIEYQCEKFLVLAKSTETKLYVLGLYPGLCPRTNEECVTFLKELFASLRRMAQNASLLVLVEKSMQTAEIMALDNNTDFFIRILDHFAPYDKATSALHVDLAGAAKLRQEFAPKKQQIKKSTLYKFERE